MELKTIHLEAGDIASHENIMFDTHFRSLVSLWFKQRWDNYTHYTQGYGDAVISSDGLRTDGDLILSVGWGDGFSISRIDDSGTITNVYSDLKPINGYQYYGSIAIEPVNKIAIVGSHATQGLTFYDYSDCFGGGDTVTKVKQLKEADGLLADEFGETYINGLAVAGEWLYYSPDEKALTQMQRVNILDYSMETIDIQNYYIGFYRCKAKYSAATDRVYFQSTYGNRRFFAVTGASTSTPKSFAINYDAMTGIDSGGNVQAIIEDKDNSNYIWTGDNFRLFKMDITDNIVDGGTNNVPTMINNTNLFHRTNDASIYSEIRFNSPIDSDFIMVGSYSGWGDKGGWVDQETGKWLVTPVSSGSLIISGSELDLDYSTEPVLVTSSGGNSYWIRSGYGGSHGHRLISFPESITPNLEESGNLETSGFQLDSGSDIEMVNISNILDKLNVPSGCTASILLSNNNGTSWESYSASNHVFSSTGNTFKIRILLEGTGNTSPYFWGTTPLTFTIVSESGNLSARRVRYRLRGGN